MTIESPKPPKRSIARKISFWAQFLGSFGSLLFSGKEDKQKVMDIANGISQTADIVVQVQDGETPQTPQAQNGENP